ncbi:MAG: aldo/keto reductase [Actinomycetota bacterium]
MNPLDDATCGTVALGGALEVRRLGYGAMRLTGPNILGPPRDPGSAAKVLRRAIDLGVNLIDTADAYGPHHNEEFIASTLMPYPEDLVIATKGGLTRDPDGDGSWPTNGHPDHLRVACEGSLQRLRVDVIDLYQFHRPDPEVPFEESIGALIELRDEGKIRLIGLSNVSIEQYEQAKAMTPIASVQNRYNVRDRNSEDVLRACEADGVAFLPYFPLQGFGFTSGSNALGTVGEGHSATPAQIALSWLLARSPVMLPIPGTSSVAHLEENIAAASIPLSDQDMERLDAINPALSAMLGKLAGPLSDAGKARVRAAAGPLRRLWKRLRFWD